MTGCEDDPELCTLTFELACELDDMAARGVLPNGVGAALIDRMAQVQRDGGTTVALQEVRARYVSAFLLERDAILKGLVLASPDP